MNPTHVRWRRGLLRLWIAASGLWLAFWIIELRPDQAFLPFHVIFQASTGERMEFPSSISVENAHKAFAGYYADRKKENAFNRFDVPPNIVDVEAQKLMDLIAAKREERHEAAVRFVYLALSPALGALTLGLLSAWVLRGFRVE